MGTFERLVCLLIFGFFAAVLVGIIQNISMMREARKAAKEEKKDATAPAVSSIPSAAVDMTPPALQQMSAQSSVVMRSPKKITWSSLYALVNRSALALASVASRVTARFRTVSGYQAQWYSVPGVQLRQPGEPRAVRRTDPKSKRTASRMRRDLIAAHRQAEGQRELNALMMHLQSTGAI